MVLRATHSAFGLLMKEVVAGLSRVDEGEIQVAPEGQDQALVCGVINRGGGVVTVADVAALAAGL
jgi:chemotaxis signal transduction protein